MTVCEARSVQHAADIAVLVQAGRSVPGHVAAGVAGVVQGPDLGGDLIGAIGKIYILLHTGHQHRSIKWSARTFHLCLQTTHIASTVFLAPV